MRVATQRMHRATACCSWLNANEHRVQRDDREDGPRQLDRPGNDRERGGEDQQQRKRMGELARQRPWPVPSTPSRQHIRAIPFQAAGDLPPGKALPVRSAPQVTRHNTSGSGGSSGSANSEGSILLPSEHALSPYRRGVELLRAVRGRAAALVGFGGTGRTAPSEPGNPVTPGTASQSSEPKSHDPVARTATSGGRT